MKLLPAASTLFLLAAAGCRPDMYNQPRYKTYAEDNFFRDGASGRPLVPHTVARGHADLDNEYFEGKTDDGRLVTTVPAPITREKLERGRERFDIYCAVCHGRTGDGRGMIVQRGFPAPPTYHSDRLRNAPIGHFYDVITNGYGVMYSYAARVDPADRWAIAAYIRALQLAQNGHLDDVPVALRDTLTSDERHSP
jgi:mono/diheme cytochrome c family protein